MIRLAQISSFIPHAIHRTLFGAAVSLPVQRYGTNGGGEKTIYPMEWKRFSSSLMRSINSLNDNFSP